MHKLKTYCPFDEGYANWIPGQLVDSLDECDLLVLIGGADVHPTIYNSPKSRRTYANLDSDKYDINLIKRAQEKGKFIWGTCRGAQLLCAYSNKGHLVQHLNHPYSHKIVTEDGREFQTNSLHHQLQYPFLMDKEDYRVLAWSESLSEMHLNGEEKELYMPDGKEPEVVYYPKFKGIGAQFHPEMMLGQKHYEPVMDYCREILAKLINGTL